MATFAPKFVPGHIKMRQLQLLSELRETRSVLRAAETLGMSQSAASRLLSSLETEIGVPLFVRHARGVVPTAYGEVVTRRALSALAELRRAAAEVRDLARGHRTPLSIGCLLSQSSNYLPAALLELTQRAPEIIVQTEVDRSRPLIEGLMQARFDMVISRVRDASLEPDLVFEPLVAEPIRVFARPRHPLARKRKLTLHDVAQYKWILPPVHTDMRARLDALCAQHGLPMLNGLVETWSVSIILGMLRRSDALVALPGDFALPYCDDGSISVLPVDLGVRAEKVGLITRRHHQGSPALRQALEVFRQVARAMFTDAELTAEVRPHRRRSAA